MCGCIIIYYSYISRSLYRTCIFCGSTAESGVFFPFPLSLFFLFSSLLTLLFLSYFFSFHFSFFFFKFFFFFFFFFFLESVFAPPLLFFFLSFFLRPSVHPHLHQQEAMRRCQDM
ncbi:hypothetical protein LI328DRAFT_12199 [Trichoderma asperelloides]|nr:hypothetical protein LI328DRAFT_12199 [Trichoderma asperelloides]